ncbi:serine hydrolase [Ruegeria sp. HKCCA6707]|nr:serine hydrolase domain-containing protein [Ruegeria sp. HKCCA6707]
MFKICKSKVLLFAVVSTILPAGVSAQKRDPSELFENAAQANPQFALGVAYVVGQNEPKVKTSGPTTFRGSTAVADDAPWHIGSIGKSFTSTLVMRLVDKGMVDLDTPIDQYLPSHKDSMHPDWRSLNLRQLLSHTAGLPANPPNKVMRKTFNNKPSAGRYAALSAMWSEPLKRSGEFYYSNVGYVLTGFVVEEVTKSTWEELIQTEIGMPFGLRSLGFGAPVPQDAATGHKSILGIPMPVPPQNPLSDNPRWMGPAGTLHLNLRDLMKWGQLHLQACAGHRNDFLELTSCQTMRTPVSSGYGLGWVIQTTKSKPKAVWHNGSNTMWYAVLYMVPEDELVIAAATNTYSPERVDELVKKLVSALTPIPE